jgi:NADH-quinone oxidoreductase subunit G
VAGVDINDLADPTAAAKALDQVGFCVSLEVRHSSVTEHADVVLPIASAMEKAGTYLSWEGRERPFHQALRNTGALTDAQVLDALAAELDVTLGLADLGELRSGWRRVLGAAREKPGALHPSRFSVIPAIPPVPERGEAVLSSWHHLLDGGALQVGEENLAATAPMAVVRLSAATAAEIGVGDGEPLTVSTDRGSITLPLAVTEMPERVVWLPTNSVGSAPRQSLGVSSGALVRVGGAQ